MRRGVVNKSNCFGIPGTFYRSLTVTAPYLHRKGGVKGAGDAIRYCFTSP